MFPKGALIVFHAVIFVYALLNPISRFFIKSTAGFYQMPEQELFIVSVLLDLLQVMTNITFFHYLALFSIKIKAPCGILPAIYFIFPLLLLILNFQDMNSQRETSMRQSGSAFQIFQFHPKPIWKSEYFEQGDTLSQNDALDLIVRQFQSKWGYYIFFALGIFSLMALLAVFIVKYYRQILKCLGFNIKCFDEYASGTGYEFIFKHIWAQILFPLASLTLLVTFLCYLFIAPGSYSQLEIVAPSSWVMWKSQSIPAYSKARETAALSAYRGKIELPSGRDWLDQRERPVYPLVTADVATVRAYNAGYSGKEQSPDAPRLAARIPAEQMPNVVAILLESFTPSPFYFSDQFIGSTGDFYRIAEDTPLFNTTYLPNLNKIAQNSAAFPALAAQGFPTYSGFLSLVSGSYLHSLGIGMVLDAYNEMDDLPSFFQHSGYQTEFVAACPLEFDVINQYGFRGYRQLRGPKRLQGLPKWFDKVHNYYPTKEQQQDLFSSYGQADELPFVHSRWSCDRLTQLQTRKAIHDYSGNKPLFMLWTTVDDHGPFQGYDSREAYKKYQFGDGLQSGYSEQGRNDRYSTLIKYTDDQVGKMYEFLKQNYPNTILLITGDHGARDVNANFNSQKVRAFDFEKGCTKGFSGNDEAVTVSGLITYLGDNENIKQYFEATNGVAFNLPTDHQDLAFTLMRTIADMRGEHFASARQGRDLLEIIQRREIKKHLSYRGSEYSLEYATERSLIRSHLLSYKGGYQLSNAVYPTCIVQKNNPPKKLTKRDYGEALQMGQLVQQITNQNRLFSYQFRDFTCVEDGKCIFPEPGGTYKSPVVLVWFLLVPACYGGIIIVSSILLTSISKRINITRTSTLTKHGWKYTSGAVVNPKVDLSNDLIQIQDI